MPTYDYLCNDCNDQFKAFHGMYDPKPKCGSCGGITTKLIVSAPAIHGAMARGRDLAIASLPQCGPGCRCCP